MYPKSLLWNEDLAYLFPVILNWHAEDTLCPVTCDLVDFGIEPRILIGKEKFNFITVQLKNEFGCSNLED